MKKFNIIMNGTPLNAYEMDEIFGGDNINCQNTVLGCCISNHTIGCGTTNGSTCVVPNTPPPCLVLKNPDCIVAPIDSTITCRIIMNSITTCI